MSHLSGSKVKNRILVSTSRFGWTSSWTVSWAPGPPTASGEESASQNAGEAARKDSPHSPGCFTVLLRGPTVYTGLDRPTAGLAAHPPSQHPSSLLQACSPCRLLGGCHLVLTGLVRFGGKRHQAKEQVAVQKPASSPVGSVAESRSLEGPAASRVPQPPESRSLEGPAASRVPQPPGSRSLEGPTASRVPQPRGSRSLQSPAASRVPQPRGSRSLQSPAASRVPQPRGSRSLQSPAASRVPQPPESRSLEGPAASRVPQPRGSRSLQSPAASRVPQLRQGHPNALAGRQALASVQAFAGVPETGQALRHLFIYSLLY
uniref:proline-rich protein 2-like n=1 Tax=Macaca mulatta TaxID=9544 RepID=UPI0010A20FCE|nr:proline-rich protein 2-like [Macaca mulatta]